MKSALQFLKMFVVSPSQTGAIAASSRGLSELITDAANLREGVSAVVEFGSGTGVFTARIMEKLPPGAIFFALELNPHFVAETRNKCPGVTVHEESAVKVKECLSRHGLEYCDRIVCGLPWAAFQKDFQESLLNATYDALRPGGRFVTFAYLQGLMLPTGLRFRKMLKQRFRQVTTTRTVWLNVPPAFVYCADK